MWGIKLLLLIAQTSLSYLWYKYILRLDSNDFNRGILEVKIEIKLKVLVSISCGVSSSSFWYHMDEKGMEKWILSDLKLDVDEDLDDEVLEGELLDLNAFENIWF